MEDTADHFQPASSLMPFLSRQRPPDLSIYWSEVPISPSDSGYQTGGSSRGRPPITRFFPSEEELEEDLDACQEEVMEDDVFAEEDELAAAAELPRSLSVMQPLLTRNRAFSFPFTLSDVQFSTDTDGGGSRLTGLSLLQARQFGSTRWLVPSWRDLPTQILEGKANGDDEQEANLRLDDIDDFEEKCPLAPLRSPSDNAGELRQDSPQALRNFSGSRLATLPDLILSGNRSGARFSLARCDHADSPDGRTDTSDMEFEIACRLARIGDEFDSKFFCTDELTVRNSPDSARSTSWISLSSARNLWKYLTKCKGSANRVMRRQRSRSTAD